MLIKLGLINDNVGDSELCSYVSGWNEAGSLTGSSVFTALL